MPRPAARPPIDVLVIGGYLGAGKTTLVNHLLREGTGRRTMVLVNDFGSLAVDDDLIESAGDGVLSLANGCICCSLQAPLIDTMLELRESPGAPDLLVIEASGVADPGPLSHHALIPGYALDGVVVVADAETVRRRAADPVVGRTIERQLRAADLLVLNKIDLVGADVAASLRTWAQDRAPHAAVLESVQARVPVAALTGLPVPAAGARSPDDPVAHAADDHERWTWQADRPIERRSLEAFLDGLPDTVVRAKGVVVLADDPEHRAVVQLVGRRWTIERGNARDGTMPTSRLVVIALPGGLPPDLRLDR